MNVISQSSSGVRNSRHMGFTTVTAVSTALSMRSEVTAAAEANVAPIADANSALRTAGRWRSGENGSPTRVPSPRNSRRRAQKPPNELNCTSAP